ncbi:MAG: hypothetical protein M1833_007232 [Piccolia ochrophora]|nr:MAG: hypothetical protein M1833_007232 [Piccolia ochrophora]
MKRNNVIVLALFMTVIGAGLAYWMALRWAQKRVNAVHEARLERNEAAAAAAAAAAAPPPVPVAPAPQPVVAVAVPAPAPAAAAA